MKSYLLPLLLLIFISLSSCTVKESIVFNEDGSGNYLISYDMADAMKKMTEEMGGGKKKDDPNKKPSRVMDTTMVFSEIMETYKDSVAALPEDKRLALEAVKDMYMEMKMDEENEIFEMGVGLNFKQVADLKNIQEKIEKAKSLNAQNDQVGAMKNGSPLGKFMGNDDNGTQYSYSASSFSRTTVIAESEDAEEFSFDEQDDMDKKFGEYFASAFYVVEYTFPKPIKSTTLEHVTFSEDRKTMTYKTNWVDFLKDPTSIDVSVEFADE